MITAGGDIHLKAGGRIVLESGQGMSFLGVGGTSFIDVVPRASLFKGTQCGLIAADLVPPGRSPQSQRLRCYLFR